MEQVNVISSDLDGAQLQREKMKNRYHTRCNGNNDDGVIQEAVNSAGKHSVMVGIPAERWEAIFGGK